MIPPPFPFPSRWKDINKEQEATGVRKWMLPTPSFPASPPAQLLSYHHFHYLYEQQQCYWPSQSPSSEANDSIHAEAESFVPVTFSGEDIKKAFQQTEEEEEDNIAVEDQEYMVDFKLELNEEWAKRLLPTAQRLKLIATPKKPSKAKKAHKKKMRAKSKAKKKLASEQLPNHKQSHIDASNHMRDADSKELSEEDDEGEEDDDNDDDEEEEMVEVVECVDIVDVV